MPIFECQKCHCIENTAMSNYWNSDDKLCSECDPEINKWHNIFPKKSAKGYCLGNDGFLYSKYEIETENIKWRETNQGFKIIGVIK